MPDVVKNGTQILMATARAQLKDPRPENFSRTQYFILLAHATQRTTITGNAQRHAPVILRNANDAGWMSQGPPHRKEY